MNHSLDKGIWITIIYDKSHSVPDMDLFYYIFTYFVPIRVIENRVTKIDSKLFNGRFSTFHLSWLINSIFICFSP